jgi:hypothetical protein
MNRIIKFINKRNVICQCKSCKKTFKWKDRGRDGTAMYSFKDYDCCPYCGLMDSHHNDWYIEV